MAAKTVFETTVGVIMVGILLTAFMAGWDWLIYAVNIEDMMGFQSQDAMNTMQGLTIIINAIPLIYIIALSINIVMDAKRRSASQ